LPTDAVQLRLLHRVASQWPLFQGSFSWVLVSNAMSAMNLLIAEPGKECYHQLTISHPLTTQVGDGPRSHYPPPPSAYGPRPPIVKQWSDAADAEESPSKKAKVSTRNTLEPECAHSGGQEHGAYISHNAMPASELKQNAGNHGPQNEVTPVTSTNYNQPPPMLAASSSPSPTYHQHQAASAPPSNYSQAPPPQKQAPPAQATGGYHFYQ
jgi:hypothetical protein